jgi:glyceraldehyde-3-phosphate dehydrogenase type I
MKRIALNGFGRIGKNFLRAYLQDPLAQRKFNIVAINIGPADLQAVPYMIMFDSVLGTYTKPVMVEGTTLMIDNFKIALLQETDAAKLPWAALHIDFVVDATGHYTHAQDAQQHIKSGAKKVIISAPAHGEDITVVMGVNQAHYDAAKHTIISLGSCTTNALTPLIHVMKTHTTIRHIIAGTVHAYTNSQALLDVNPHIKDLRKSRAAATNIIPATTGAAISVAAIFPEYKTTMSASALRVPVPIVSLADVTLLLEKPVSAEAVHGWFNDAARTVLKDILVTSQEQLVSSDFQGNSNSVIFDETLTLVAGPLVRLYGWYDNEWAYSNRIKDFLIFAS